MPDGFCSGDIVGFVIDTSDVYPFIDKFAIDIGMNYFVCFLLYQMMAINLQLICHRKNTKIFNLS